MGNLFLDINSSFHPNIKDLDKVFQVHCNCNVLHKVCIY